MVVIYTLRLTNVHYTLYCQAIVKFVLVTQVAAVELKAHIVVLFAKSCVEVTKDLNDSLTLGLYGCGILCLCVDTNAG